MKVGFCIYEFCSRLASNLGEKQFNMGSRGPTHQDGVFHSHAKHLDTRSTD